MSERRLIVVHNPHSTRANKVQRDVLNRLHDTRILFDEFVPQSTATEDNIADMRDVLRNGDTILSAAGDGTAMQVANAVLRNEHHDSQIGFLGYGNFNDLSRDQRDPVKLLEGTPVPLYPLTIDVNGQYWRDAPGYLTIGFTAIAAAQFGSTTSRERQQNLPENLKLLASLGQLGTTYFQERHRMLPPFHTSESLIVQRAVTDILAVNSPRVGRVIRAKDYSAGDDFGFRTADISTIPKNLPFGAQALLHRAPAEALDDIAVHFEQPVSVPIQSEGEFAQLTAIDTVHIYKDPERVLTILRTAS